ncbi:3-phenylpropionate-dihydrodiol/cinnamic acid-dihydrodiol dehydrogenase [Usitatibacter rugosus]|uniref:3-phenylpropionate-dihydrodiol/cinnamic acid-dihydrodiol dehydrogenase n=1 Tax=Usitatibacter rugosus TaxID=2732067 RepID=A0A6M4H1D2_9PROT|nr:SDR family oxidoreductase [Usitatibacter rugosus]QJR13152.1 3-phenylpropionate-dihydrodiol/cinnamic acid-dihydrodiol dehydrogenase [Usitatibacter rugosus]
MKVFLTGASSGIGEALARFYAAQGATLGLLARREEQLRTLQGTLGVPVEIYPADVTDLKAVKAAAESFIAKHGVPDIVIGNAGVSHGTLTEFEDDVDVFRQIMDINVNGLVNTFHPFIAPMRGQRAGSLVGVASVAGFRGIPGASAYSASKAAAIRYCESLRVELRGTGVQVTTICPGYIATPMTEKNPYPMPFLIPADDFARRFGRAVAARKSLAVIPWQMAIVARLLTVLPNFLYDAAFAKAGRKPRKN